MKTRDKIYVIVPSTLLGLLLILLIFNSYIVSYMPPKLLLLYPFKPCWPNNGGIHTEGVPRVYDVQVSNLKPIYKVGESINPNIASATTFDVYVPRVYIQNSQNQTIWIYGGLQIVDNCRTTLHYSLQDLITAPKIDATGNYKLFVGPDNSFPFSVVS